MTLARVEHADTAPLSPKERRINRALALISSTELTPKMRAKAQVVGMQSTGEEVLGVYVQTPNFRKIYRPYMSESFKPSEGPLGQFVERLGDDIYRDLVPTWVQGQLADWATLVPPTRTLAFYRNLHPEIDPQRKSLPYGLIISKPTPEASTKIEGLFVPTMPDTTYIERVVEQFNQDKKEHPDFFDKNGVILVVSPEVPEYKSGPLFEEAYLKLLPFSLPGFRALVFNMVYLGYRSKVNFPTLAEIQDRVSVQQGSIPHQTSLV